MEFRVTFTNDVDEYYKENPKDVRMSLTVQASSFEKAIITAKATMESYVFWPNFFEVVSVQHTDYVEPVPVHNYDDGCRCEDCVHEYQHVTLLRPFQWEGKTGVTVMDPDGWRGKNDPSWETPITRDEFINRARFSTCQRFPLNLWDE